MTELKACVWGYPRAPAQAHWRERKEEKEKQKEKDQPDKLIRFTRMNKAAYTKIYKPPAAVDAATAAVMTHP